MDKSNFLLLYHQLARAGWTDEQAVKLIVMREWYQSFPYMYSHFVFYQWLFKRGRVGGKYDGLSDWLAMREERNYNTLCQ